MQQLPQMAFREFRHYRRQIGMAQWVQSLHRNRNAADLQ